MLRRAFEQGAISQQQYERAAISLTRRQQILSSSYSSLRGSMSNVGFQLQDIAVQMQMGVNPAVILSQQGSQLVSSFNPLAGAIIAVSGAVVGALLPSFFNAGKATEDLRNKIEKLHEDYTGLTESQRQFLTDQESSSRDKLLSDIKKQRSEIETLTRRYNELAAAKNGASAPTGGVSTMGIGFGGGGGTVEGADKKAAQKLTAAKAELDTKNEDLIESEKQLRRINGEKIQDDKELLKQANQLVEKLKEETETYKLSGETLGVYVADKLKLKDGLRAQVIELYKQQEAQKKATEAEREAAAEEKSRQRQAETTARSNETYVKGLEAQAVATQRSARETAEAEFAERGLTGALLERARAAKQITLAESERHAITELRQKLTQASPETQAPNFEQFREQFKRQLDQLGEDSKAEGEKIVRNLFDIATLENQLKKANAAIDRALDTQQRQEASINVQREAGSISEYDARNKLLELHKATYAELEKQRPLLEELKKQPGAVGEAAAIALEQLDAQGQRLLTTTSELQRTLKEGLSSGLNEALSGLAKGTLDFKDAVKALANEVSNSLIRMAANSVTERAVGAIMGLFGDKKADPAAGAAATASAAAALASAGGVVLAAAQAMMASAQALAAAGGGNSSGGAGGGTASLITTFASLFASTGGQVVGPGTGTSDSIPAMLSNNEFVTRAAIVQQPLALNFLHDFNSRGMAALQDWAYVRHATGGLAGEPAPAMPSPTLSSELASPASDSATQGQRGMRIINVVDKELVRDWAESAAGEKVIVNLIRRNGQALWGSKS